MQSDETQTSVSSGTGFLAMFGAVSTVFAFVGLGLLESGLGASATASAFLGAAFGSYVLLAPAAAGLYYRHRRTFGYLGVVGTAVAVLALLSNGLNGLGALVTGDAIVTGPLSFALFLGSIVGSLLLGAAVVRAGALPNATGAGLLIALGLPVSYALLFGLATLEVSLPDPLVGLVYGGPYAAGWLLVGFDMFTEGDAEMPGPEADLRD